MKKLFIIIGVILIAFILFSFSLYRLSPYRYGFLWEKVHHTGVVNGRQQAIGNLQRLKMKSEHPMTGVFAAVTMSGPSLDRGQTRPNFSGRWALNIEQCKDLPRQLNNAQILTRIVTQEETQIRVENEISWKSGSPGGGAGPPGGRRPPRGSPRQLNMENRAAGDSIASPSATYNLNGEEKQENVVNGAPGVVKLKAQWLIIGENQVLQLTSVRSFDAQGRNEIVTNHERWTLASDGKTLSVELHTISPGSDEISHMIFRRLSL